MRRAPRGDGTRFPVEVRGRHTQFRGDTVRIAVVSDITDKRRRETELKNQAELLRTLSLRDELTSRYDRRGFQEHAQRQLRQAARTKRSPSVFFIDLDGMKTINDRAGLRRGRHALDARAAGATPRRAERRGGRALPSLDQRRHGLFDPMHPSELDALLETVDREMYERKRTSSDSSTATAAAARRAAGG